MKASALVLLLLVSGANCYSRRKSVKHERSRKPVIEMLETVVQKQVKREPNIHVSHMGIAKSHSELGTPSTGHLRPSPRSGCFWKVVSCRTKVTNNNWDLLDCFGDQETIKCCDFECMQKEKMIDAMEKEAKKKAVEEAEDSLAQLQQLEAQRQHIMGQLEEAKQRVIQFVQPDILPQDLAPLANLPPSSGEELDTLVEVAEAVMNSDASIDESIRESLEEKILDNIMEVTKEAVKDRGGVQNLQDDRQPGKVKLHIALSDGDEEDFENEQKEELDEEMREHHPGHVENLQLPSVDLKQVDSVRRINQGDPFEDEDEPLVKMSTNHVDGKVILNSIKTKAQKEEDFLKKNDIMQADDPFSQFLKEEMGM